MLWYSLEAPHLMSTHNIYVNEEIRKIFSRKLPLIWSTNQKKTILFIFLYLHFNYVTIYDKAVMLVAVHFSVQNIELSRDLGHAIEQGYKSVCL